MKRWEKWKKFFFFLLHVSVHRLSDEQKTEEFRSHCKPNEDHVSRFRFPSEFGDKQRRHIRVLWEIEPSPRIDVNMGNLRLQLEILEFRNPFFKIVNK